VSEICLRVSRLSKQYRLGRKQERYRTLRDVIAQAVVRPFARLRGRETGGGREQTSTGRRGETLWALKDVSFDVSEGEVVGIVGRNGAGKSTLLKVLARITEPTSGYADVTGRIGSLIEVGTGFHPELTGRENVFLNGAILGMKRSELTRKFDQIVEFAEVDRFIDTAIKHYSSGMYLRLAFAVAAYLEPDILLVDEVLAVGDIAFQTKCLEKMGEVARHGRTVLFVSHNMSAVTELCTRAILLDGGRVAFSGSPHQTVGAYLRTFEREPEAGEPEPSGCSVGAIRVNGGGAPAIVSGMPFAMSVTLRANQLRNPWMFFIIEDALGRTVVHSRTSAQDIGTRILDGPCDIRLDIPALWLSPGVYTAYFKFLTSVADGSTGRALSPRLALEVRGEAEHTGQAVLNPSVSWSTSTAAVAVSEQR
jgi:lipopolysaccharide transport system ATP-binding protein